MELFLNHPASNKTSAKSNNSAFFYFEFCQAPSLVLLLTFIACTVVLIIGFFRNLSLIIIIFKKQRGAQNVTNILIASLSLSDILVCVMCIPILSFTLWWTTECLGISMCRLTSYVQSVSISCVIFSLVLIAVERYQLIVNPQGWKPSVAYTYCSITLIWLFSLLLSIPFFLSYHLTNEPFWNFSLPTHPYTHWVACAEN